MSTEPATAWYTHLEGVVRDALDRIDNPLTRAVSAGALTAGLIAATTAFGPVGVVGTGWWLVYTVAGGTLGLETGKQVWQVWRQTPRAKRRKLAAQLAILKLALERGLISQDEYDRYARGLVTDAVGAKPDAA